MKIKLTKNKIIGETEIKIGMYEGKEIDKPQPEQSKTKKQKSKRR